jgi:homogentisate 1,2-dioxygenase
MTTNQLHNAFWADVVLSAASIKEPFEEVSVVTLRAHFADRVYERAIDMLLNAGEAWDDAAIKAKAQDIVRIKPPTVTEQVVFNADGSVLVVIDVPVIDENTTFAVMEMISKALDMPRAGNRVVLGRPITFSALLDC